MPDLTEVIKQKARELGADLVGIAPIDRFKNAPLRMSPQGLLPGAKYVVVSAMHHPDAMIELDGEPTSHEMGPYGMQTTGMNARLDDISFLLARFIEGKGHRALPIAASNIWRYTGYKDLKVSFAPDMAHRYAAVAAGLGIIGYSGLCLSPEFGPRNRFVSVITDAELTATPMYDGDPLCDQCFECVNTCPTDAFRKEVVKMNKIEIGGHSFEFPETNKWRCAWAENFQLNLAHRLPEVINHDVILKYMEKYGEHKGEFGYCLRFCMTPERRYYQADYSRAPRRKKAIVEKSPEKMLAKVNAICTKHLIDVVAIDSKDRFADALRVHPDYHLPDVETVICFGVKAVAGAETADVKTAITRRIDYTEYEISRYLDIMGYSATARTKIASNLVAEKLGIYDGDTYFATVLTSAKLPAQVVRRATNTGKVTAEELRKLAKAAGADLVGFFNEARYKELTAALQALNLVPEIRTEVEDQGTIYGPFVPKVKHTKVKIKGLGDWLPGAKGVMLLAIHYPDQTLDTAKVTPAETVGPFAFVQHETLHLLRDTAYEVIKRLNDGGYHATLATDITGLASQVKNCRGFLPDMRANAYEALLAGLATPGVHGHPMTPQFGVRQRFMAIITDCPLPNDALPAWTSACEGCPRPCVDACPTDAVTTHTTTLTIEGKSFNLYDIDCFACDWAKRYALSNVEGPTWHGIDVDFPVPPSKNEGDIVHAVTLAKWGVQKRLLNVAEECLRVCPAKGNHG
jgi:epoxyqueuosine reductase QueG